MAIQHRRGIYDRFDPSRLVAGEWAIVLSGDTSASDGRAAYICFAAGTVKRIATYEDMAESIANANEELIEELTAQITAATTAANTAASNANTKATAANTAASSANTAASAANTAASNANSKATAANTAASSANSAASSATTAAGRANTAADAANAAATSATEAAESVSDAAYRAETAATSANTAAGSANAAAQRANTAADSANAATSEANAAIEAMGDISELAVPEMTASVRGGAKVGGSTQVIDEKLEVKLSESATGTSITTGSTSALKELQVHGRSVQDGTPTPDVPVDVQVVSGKNLLHDYTLVPSGSGITWVKNEDGTFTANGTASSSSSYAQQQLQFIADFNGDFVVSGCPSGGGSASYNVYVWDVEANKRAFSWNGSTASASDFGGGTQVKFEQGKTYRLVLRIQSGYTASNLVFSPQIERDSQATPYVPYGSIGIVVGDTATPIDLQGNKLASLPAGASVLTSGARDVLRVDSAGHTTADMETGIVVFDGSDDEDWSIATIFGNQPYTTALNNAVLKPPSNGRAVPMLCNRLTATAPSAITTGTIGMALTVTGSLVVRMGSGDADLTAFKADLAANPLVIIYPLATPQTIDLGYIDPPAIPSGSIVTVSASLTPTFDLVCWTEHASELAETTAALENEISSLRAQIAALATS